MKKNMMDIWKDSNFVPLCDGGFDLTARTMGAVPLLKDLFNKTSGHLSEFYSEGYVGQESDDEDENAPLQTIDTKYIDYFTQKGGRLIYRFIRNNGGESIFLWKDGIADLNVSDTWIGVRVLSHDESFVKDIKSYFDTQWKPLEKTGHIYAIMRQGMHLSLSSIGNAGIPLVESNYTTKVMEDYKFAIQDLQSSTPSGRIVIMKGTPGTGKTHLVRASLLEVPDAMFVLISPDAIKSLAGPELLPLLMNHRGGTTGPIVLILEDADKCLISRESEQDDISSIQAILNLGDGILGSLLDLRIIATTNASEFKMDRAILRPGRLSKMIDVTPLDFDSARVIFSRLLPDVDFPEVLQNDNPHVPLQITLAETYALARQNGWTGVVRKIKENNSLEEEADWED